VNKTQVPSKKEQRIVTQLIERGPKVLFVSLNKEDADEFYKTVPDDQKARIDIYPVTGDRSLVKWANTIQEYELVDNEISIVQMTQRWYHAAAQDFQGHCTRSSHPGPPPNDTAEAMVRRLASNERGEEPKGCSDPYLAYSTDKDSVSGSTSTNSASQPASESLGQGLGEPLSEFNNPRCDSVSSSDSHPSIPASGDDHQVHNTGIPLTSIISVDPNPTLLSQESAPRQGSP
jgi:hypothetical protein